jgi:hypothetical protein
MPGRTWCAPMLEVLMIVLSPVAGVVDQDIEATFES